MASILDILDPASIGLLTALLEALKALIELLTLVMEKKSENNRGKPQGLKEKGRRY